MRKGCSVRVRARAAKAARGVREGIAECTRGQGESPSFGARKISIGLPIQITA